MPAAPSSACPRPRPASSVQCPERATSVHPCLSTGPMSSVRCGRLRVQVSAVRRPLSGVGVRCLCVAASAVSGRSEVLERGGGVGSRTAGMAGVDVVARCVHARLVVCLSRAPCSKLAQVVLGQPRHRFGPGRRRGRWLGSGQLDRVADQDRPGAREDHSLVGAGAQRARLLRQADRQAAGESLGRSCRVESNIKKPIGHIPLAKQNLTKLLVHLPDPTEPVLPLLTCHFIISSASASYYQPAYMPLSFVLSSPQFQSSTHRHLRCTAAA
jgi:hypothetical protein